jgi:hypothetical protein
VIVLKHELRSTIGEPQKVALTIGCEIIKVDIQRSRICLWAVHHAVDHPRHERQFVIVATGQESPHIYKRTHIGTIQDGVFVWHIFEVME